MKNAASRLTLVCISLVITGLILTGRSSAEFDLNDVAGAWLLDEGAGDKVSDFSGNGNDGEINGAKWVAGHSDGALEFDGVGNDVAVVNASPGIKSPSLTVTAWVKVASAPGGHEDWVAAQGDNWGLVVDRWANNDDVFIYFYDGGGWPDLSSGDVDVLDNQWHHIAGVLDDDNDMMYVYKDGVQVGKRNMPGSIVYNIGNGFTIGSMQGARIFKGVIDEVAVFSKALSEDDIKTLMTKGLKGALGITPVEPSGRLTATWGRMKNGD